MEHKPKERLMLPKERRPKERRPKERRKSPEGDQGLKGHHLGLIIRTQPEINKGLSAKEVVRERQLRSQRELMERTFKSKEKQGISNSLQNIEDDNDHN